MINHFAEEYVVTKPFESNGRVIEVGEVWQNTGYAMGNSAMGLSTQFMREVEGKREWIWVSAWRLNESFEEYKNKKSLIK